MTIDVNITEDQLNVLSAVGVEIGQKHQKKTNEE